MIRKTARRLEPPGRGPHAGLSPERASHREVCQEEFGGHIDRRIEPPAEVLIHPNAISRLTAILCCVLRDFLLWPSARRGTGTERTEFAPKWRKPAENTEKTRKQEVWRFVVSVLLAKGLVESVFSSYSNPQMIHCIS